MTEPAVLSEKRLAWMLKKMGGLAVEWISGGVTYTVTAEEAGALHRHQTEGMREQIAIYSPEGVVRQPHLCVMVAASAMEGKAVPERGDKVTVNGTLYRLDLCEEAADGSHLIFALNEEAQ